MLLELFPFVILNNAMAFVYAYFLSDFFSFEMSLLLLIVTLRGVSNKNCLLYFSFNLCFKMHGTNSKRIRRNNMIFLVF